MSGTPRPVGCDRSCHGALRLWICRINGRGAHGSVAGAEGGGDDTERARGLGGPAWRTRHGRAWGARRVPADGSRRRAGGAERDRDAAGRRRGQGSSALLLRDGRPRWCRGLRAGD